MSGIGDKYYLSVSSHYQNLKPVEGELFSQHMECILSDEASASLHLLQPTQFPQIENTRG